MLRSASLVLILLSVPAGAASQQWSSEQQEVWDALAECVGHWAEGRIDAALECNHDDFRGWVHGDPIPRSKQFLRTIDPYFVRTRETQAHHLEPLHIKVIGQVAIIHYIGSWVQIGPGGSEEVSTWGWTDIMVNENGRWMWIADHGGPMADSRSGT